VLFRSGAGAPGWRVAVRSGSLGTGLEAVAWAKLAVALGAGEVLATSIDRDGTLTGYDLEFIAALAGAVNVPIIASGGASEPGHLVAALEAGASGLLAASIFHEGRYTAGEVKAALAAAGVEVRT
jgi:cyclase